MVKAFVLAALLAMVLALPAAAGLPRVQIVGTLLNPSGAAPKNCTLTVRASSAFSLTDTNNPTTGRHQITTLPETIQVADASSVSVLLAPNSGQGNDPDSTFYYIHVASSTKSYDTKWQIPWNPDPLRVSDVTILNPTPETTHSITITAGGPPGPTGPTGDTFLVLASTTSSPTGTALQILTDANNFLLTQPTTRNYVLQLATAGVTNSIIGPDAVTTDKVLDGTLLIGDLASSVRNPAQTLDGTRRITTTAARAPGTAGAAGTGVDAAAADHVHPGPTVGVSAGSDLAAVGIHINGAGLTSVTESVSVGVHTIQISSPVVIEPVTVLRGGTGSTTFTAGGVLFMGPSGNVTEDSDQFHWDPVNRRLSIGDVVLADFDLQIRKSAVFDVTAQVWNTATGSNSTSRFLVGDDGADSAINLIMFGPSFATSGLFAPDRGVIGTGSGATNGCIFGAGAGPLYMVSGGLDSTNVRMHTDPTGNITMTLQDTTGVTKFRVVDADGNPLFTVDSTGDTTVRATHPLFADQLKATTTNGTITVIPNGTGGFSFGSTPVEIKKLADGSDATGDIGYRGADERYHPLPIGTTGKVLTVASGLPSWQAPTGGGGGGTIETQVAGVTVTLNTTVINLASGFTATESPSGTVNVTASGGGGGGLAGPGDTRNLRAQVITNDKMWIRADSISLSDGSNWKNFPTVNVTLDISAATGANGPDGAGTVDAASTWVWVYLIGKSDGTVASLGSLTDSPTLPSGYTFVRHIGGARNDGSSNFIRNWQHGSYAETNTPANPSVSSGATFATLDISSFAPPWANTALLRFEYVSGTDIQFLTRPNFTFGADDEQSRFRGSAKAQTYWQQNMADGQKFDYWLTTGTGTLIVHGWYTTDL